jgi:SAM-dependent methyltransferase
LDGETFPPESFDLVCLWHVLEHLQDPGRALALSWQWLRPGGALMIAVPNADSWQARLFRGNWFHLDYPRHLVQFTAASLVQLVGAAKFGVVKMRHFSIDQNPYGILQSALNTFGFPWDDLYEMLKGNCHFRPSALHALEVLAAALLAGPSLLFAGVEAAVHQGGTVELVARKLPKASATLAERSRPPAGGRAP